VQTLRPALSLLAPDGALLLDEVQDEGMEKLEGRYAR